MANIRTVTIEVKMDLSNAERGIATLTAELKLMGDEVKKTGASTSDFERLVTNSSRKSGNALKDMQRKSRDLRDEVDRLRSEFKKTSSASVFGDLQKATNDFRKLQGFIKTAGGEAGILAGNDFFAQFRRRVGLLGPFLTPEGALIGAALLAGATPIIGGAIAGAISGGVGLGLIAAAAVIQKGNPQLSAAWGKLSTDAGNVLKRATDILVPDLISGLSIFDKAVNASGGQLYTLFHAVAPAVNIVATDLSSLGTTILPGLTRTATTFSKALANPDVQHAIQAVNNQFNTLFSTVGRNPQLIADSFHALNTILDGTLATINAIIEAGNGIDTALHKVHDYIQGKIDQVGGAPPVQPPRAGLSTLPNHGAGGGFMRPDDVSIKQWESFTKAEQAAFVQADDLQHSLTHTQTGMILLVANGVDPLNASLKNLDAALNSVSGATEDYTKANIDVKQAMADFTKTVEANKKAHDKHALSLSIDTQTGRDNVTAILRQIDANKTAYEKQVALEAPIKGVDQALKDANVTYAANTKKVEANAAKLGFNKQKVDALIKANGSIPPAVDTTYTTPGLSKALSESDRYVRVLSEIPQKISTKVETIFSTKGSKAAGRPNTGPLSQTARRWGGIDVHADMGLVNAGIYAPPTRYAFAEPQTGGEAFVPKYGNYARSMGILSAAAGWYGAHVVPGGGRGGGGGGGPMTLYVMGGDDTGRALIKTLRFAIGQGGGDPVYVLTPRGF